MKLKESPTEDPTKSELEIFKALVERSMTIQQQIHSSYHGDRQLRDRLINGVNCPTIKEEVTDRHMRKSHQRIERVANELSHKPSTAGKSVESLNSSKGEKEKVK